MIIVRFDGGLGNQMLQYASYLALQQRFPGVKVVADIRKYNMMPVHNGFELDQLFQINLNVQFGKVGNNISMVLRCWHYILHNSVTLFFKIGLNKYCFIKDTGILNQNLFHLKRDYNYYLDGQWGNEKYFKDVEELLRRHFAFNRQLDPVNEKLSREIKSVNSVSVHIRRGDYVEKETSFFDLSKSNYYPEAFTYLSKIVKDPVFYIFSNNPDWCRKNFKWLKNYKHDFVNGNTGNESYKDMQLMSFCQHNIIANSTFSWWGGWLNNNQKKIIICPSTLFNDTEANNKILSQFYPESWIKI